MTIVSSPKRAYVIGMSPRKYGKSVALLSGMSPTQLQDYIDYCFDMANKLSKSTKGGAWDESKSWRDKAKLAVLVKEGLES